MIYHKEKCIKCKNCKTYFKILSELENHSKKCFKCEQCWDCFSSKRQLKQHMNTPTIVNDEIKDSCAKQIADMKQYLNQTD